MASTPKARIALARVLPVVLGAIGLVMLLLAARSFLGSAGFAYDYGAYDAAARRVAAGEALYPPGTAEAYNSGSYAGLYLYPPPLAVALAPMSLVNADIAAQLWLGLRLLLLALGVWMLPVSWFARAATFAVSGITFPVWYDLNLGNISIVLFAVSAVIWRCRDRPSGGIALGVAGALRFPFGIVLLSLALARRWTPVAWTVATGIVIGVATLPFVGVGAWFDYFGTIRTLGDVSGGPENLNLGTTAIAIGLPGAAGIWTILGIATALVASVYAALRRERETAIVVSLAATMIFFPFFHPHYLVQLLIPAAFLAGRGQWWGLVLPLLAWGPAPAMAPLAVLGTLAPLVPATFASIRGQGATPITDARATLGAATGF
jgi:hypothetical protein